MERIFKTGIVLIFILGIQTSQAQFLKRIKNKIENKIEQKSEEKIDDLISGRKKEKQKQKELKDNSENVLTKTVDFGDVIITHSNTYDAVQIPEVSQIKAIRSNTEWTFNTSWWSHDADIHDGFIITIKDTSNLRHDINKDESLKRSYKIPEEATLKLSYDPTLIYYKDSKDGFKKAVSNEYQSYNVSKGEVTIDVLSKEAIQISFTGKATLKKIINRDNKSDDYTETYFESTIKGAIEGVTPYFINNQSVSKKEDKKGVVASQNGRVKEVTKVTVIPDIYQFNYETLVKITTDKNETYKMSYLLNSTAEYMGIKVNMNDYSDDDVAGESIIIIDKGDSHIFVETQGMKMQMSQSMMGSNQQSNPTDQMANYDYANLKKTGNTKTVLGAACYEFTMSDNDVKMQLWVAPDVKLPNWFIQNREVLNGHIMEYTIESKDGNMTSETIAINNNINKIINPKDYKKMF